MGSGLSDPARPLTPCIILIKEGRTWEPLGREVAMSSLSWPLGGWGVGFNSRILPRAFSSMLLWHTFLWLIHVFSGLQNAKSERQVEPEPV